MNREYKRNSQVIVMSVLLAVIISCKPKSNRGPVEDNETTQNGSTVGSSASGAEAEMAEFEIITDLESITDTSPLIEWQDAEASSYSLYIGREQDCSDRLQEHLLITDLSFTIDSLTAGGQYYVCLTALDELSNEWAASNGPAVMTIAPSTLLFEVVSDLEVANDLSDAVLGPRDEIWFALTANALLSDSSQQDVMIRRLSHDGSILTDFDTVIDGNQTNELSAALALSSDGGLGLSINSVNLVSGSSEQDYLIKAFDDEWNVVWSKSLNSSGSNIDAPSDIEFDASGNLFIAGSYNHYQYSIKKFSTSGTEDTTNWDHSFAGANGNDFAQKVLIGNDAIYTIGYGARLTANDAGFDWWIKKFNVDGAEDSQWDVKLDVSGNKQPDRIWAAAQSGDGSLYLGGVTDGTTKDWVIRKLSSAGTSVGGQWNKTIDGNSGSDTIADLVVGPDAKIYVLGSGTNLVTSASGSDWWLKRYDADGNEDSEFEMKIDGSLQDDTGRRIVFDSTGDYYVIGTGVGVAGSASGATGAGFWIRKYARE